MACTLILAWLGRVIAVFGSSFRSPLGGSIFRPQNKHSLFFYNEWITVQTNLHLVFDFWDISGVHQCLSVKKDFLICNLADHQLFIPAVKCWARTVRRSLRIALSGLPSKDKDFSLGNVPSPEGKLLYTRKRSKYIHRTTSSVTKATRFTAHNMSSTCWYRCW